MRSPALHDKPGYRWIVFGISYLLMLFFAVPLQALPPLLSSIAAEIPFSSSRAGLLMGAYGLPGLFMPLAAAALAMRYDQPRVVAAGLGLMGVGLLLFANSSSYWGLLGGRLVSGIGAKVVLSLAPIFVITFFSEHRLGTAVGLFNTAVPLGSILSLNAFGYLGPALGWRRSVGASSLAALVLAGLVLGALRVPRTAGGSKSLSLRGTLPRSVWALTFLNFLINALNLAYVTFAPGFYSSTGFSAHAANLLVSLIIVEEALFGPLFGYLMDARGHKKPLLLAGGAVMALAYFLLASEALPPYLPVLLLGLGASVVPVVVFPLLKDMVGPAEIPLAIALLIIASNLGSAVGPAVFGLALDRGGYAWSFAGLGAASLAILPFTLRLSAGTRPGTEERPQTAGLVPEPLRK